MQNHNMASLIISIIILIIVIIVLIIIVCYSYNNNNDSNQPHIQNPGLAAAAAYKYGMNGGRNKNHFAMDQCGSGEASCSCYGNPLVCHGVCDANKECIIKMDY